MDESSLDLLSFCSTADFLCLEAALAGWFTACSLLFCCPLFLDLKETSLLTTVIADDNSDGISTLLCVTVFLDLDVMPATEPFCGGAG